MTPFKQKVLKIVNLIPSGKVVSYGQVALYIGVPRAARQVGWVLRGLGDNQNIPWWRVVNKSGRISINGNFNADRDLQKKLLEAEKIEVRNYQIEMEKYRFKPGKKILKKMELADSYINDIVARFSI
ncbi:MAG TPA: MGMT family protein [Candidatus Saccharimonadales bacterium]|nr:MGMT family protein [Candidatus Saccharimonadales bacterium]